MKITLAISAVALISATATKADEQIQTIVLVEGFSVLQTNTKTGEMRVCMFDPPLMTAVAGGNLTSLPKAICGEWHE